MSFNPNEVNSPQKNNYQSIPSENPPITPVTPVILPVDYEPIVVNNQSENRSGIIQNKIYSNCYSCVCIAINYIIWYSLFSAFTYEQKHEPGNTCVNLVYQSESLTTFFFSMIIIYSVLILLSICSNDSKVGEPLFSCLKFIVSLIQIVFTFVFLISMTIALRKGENCKDLMALALVWVIIIYTGLAVVCCCVCCVGGVIAMELFFGMRRGR
jgi:magnesium-transporting ATPase (P-type)